MAQSGPWEEVPVLPVPAPRSPDPAAARASPACPMAQPAGPPGQPRSPSPPRTGRLSLGINPDLPGRSGLPRCRDGAGDAVTRGCSIGPWVPQVSLPTLHPDACWGCLCPSARGRGVPGMDEEPPGGGYSFLQHSTRTQPSPVSGMPLCSPGMLLCPLSAPRDAPVSRSAPGDTLVSPSASEPPGMPLCPQLDKLPPRQGPL